ncbi:MAG: hypothetical protein CFE25_17730 [Chitinophagaceae bacterium BSSC1]|nr:MAG: hypothetical protein CFE25_17730 [Chitinophagaceae bacterium BSSC1]
MYLNNNNGMNMKRLASILPIALLLLLGSCAKEGLNDFKPYTNNELNDTAWVKTISNTANIFSLADTLFQKTYFTDSIDLTKDQNIQLGDTLELEFKGNCLTTGTGLLQDGKAKIELIKILKKGDFIKAFRPNSSNGYPLETGGAFFIRITKNGNELVLAPGTSLKIKWTDIEAPKQNMQAFYGKEGFPIPTSALDSSHNWFPDNDTSWLKPWVKNSGNGEKRGYILETKKLRWISAQHVLVPNTKLTNIYGILPPNYTNKNTLVFAVFANSRTVLSLKSDFTSRSFTTGNVPMGTRMTLVSISKIDKNFYLGTKLINDVGTVVNYSFTPEKKSLAQILEYLNSL